MLLELDMSYIGKYIDSSNIPILYYQYLNIRYYLQKNKLVKSYFGLFDKFS